MPILSYLALNKAATAFSKESESSYEGSDSVFWNNNFQLSFSVSHIPYETLPCCVGEYRLTMTPFASEFASLQSVPSAATASPIRSASISPSSSSLSITTATNASLSSTVSTSVPQTHTVNVGRVSFVPDSYISL